MCVGNFHDFDLHIVVSAMAGIVRESTMAQVINAANAVGTLLSVFPKMLEKLRDLIVYLFTNFKEVMTLVLLAIGVIVCLFVANHYIENEYHVKARLSRFFDDQSTAVKEF